MVLLFIIVQCISHFVIVKTLGKDKKEKQISESGYMICCGILILVGMLISALGLIVNYEFVMVIGIAILSIGIAFVITRLLLKCIDIIKNRC